MNRRFAWISLLALGSITACSHGEGRHDSSTDGRSDSQDSGPLVDAGAPDASSCPPGALKIYDEHINLASGEPPPFGDRSLCERAWRSLEDGRGANGHGDPFATLDAGAQTWGRTASAGSVIAVATPSKYDSYKVESCPGTANQPLTTISCSVPISWQIQAASIGVGTHPVWHRFEEVYTTDKTTGAIIRGQEIYGGLTTMYQHAGTITPFTGNLYWGLYPEGAAIDAAKARALLGLPQQQGVEVQTLSWSAPLGARTVGVSFGNASTLAERSLWGLAGRAIHDRYDLYPGQEVGFAAFGARTDQALTREAYMAKYWPYEFGSAVAWDSSTRAAAPCSVDIDLPYEQQCNGLLVSRLEALRRGTLAVGKPLCVSVLWTTSSIGTFVTTACIAPNGDIDQPETKAVSLDALGLPSIDEIDSLGSDM